VLVSGLHSLCPYLEVNRSYGHPEALRAVLSWLTPPCCSYGRLFSQIILEAGSGDIRVAVSIWLFFIVFSCFLLFCVILCDSELCGVA